ncbi:MAG: sigma-70 family RNA polymerase sigma factor [Armatimonadetes bacterium]|nr:sigma-70 family RNA polymerase sigma factor [Armatimonadota bacterium]
MGNVWGASGSKSGGPAGALCDMSGRKEDFERVVELYERRLYNVAIRLAGSPEEAAELTQETFVRAFRAWDRFRREAKVYTWLYRILINLNKDRLARAARRREHEVPLPPADSELTGVETQAVGAGPERSAETSELREVLAEAIEGLPQGYRECIVLKDLEGLSYEEISEVMGITVEAVRSRLARARQHLRQKLAPYLKTQ